MAAVLETWILAELHGAFTKLSLHTDTEFLQELYFQMVMLYYWLIRSNDSHTHSYWNETIH